MNKLSNLKSLRSLVNSLNSKAAELITANTILKYSYKSNSDLLSDEEMILRNLYALDKRLDGILSSYRSN